MPYRKNLELLATIFPDPGILDFQDFKMPEDVKAVDEKNDKPVTSLNDAEKLLFVISTIAQERGSQKHLELKRFCGEACAAGIRCPFPEEMREVVDWLNVALAFTKLMWKKVENRIDCDRIILEIRQGFQIITPLQPASPETLEEMGFKCRVDYNLSCRPGEWG